MLTISLSHLLGRGVRLETHEAIALARELLAHPCGVPTPENIQLGSDGSASCTSTAGMPSVASVAHLLLTLLPVGSPSVPSSLRYAVARGLGAVEAPPFASLGEFSIALGRFEKGARREVLRGVLQRGARPSRPRAAAIAVVPEPTPVTPPATPPEPAASRPTVVSSRRTLVDRQPVASSKAPRAPIAAAPPMFWSFGQGEQAVSPRRSWRRLAVTAALALAASFTVGFAVGDRIMERRAATQPSGSARVRPGVPPAAPAANHWAGTVLPAPSLARETGPPAPAQAAGRKLEPMPE